MADEIGNRLDDVTQDRARLRLDVDLGGHPRHQLVIATELRQFFRRQFNLHLIVRLVLLILILECRWRNSGYQALEPRRRLRIERREFHYGA